MKSYLKRTERLLEELERGINAAGTEGEGQNSGSAEARQQEKTQDSGSGYCERLQKEKVELLTQIGFFQHERLVHLIVTALFAMLAIIVFVVAVTAFSPWSGLLLLLLLVLLIPYIRHYYILENGVQRLYEYYDRLEAMQSRAETAVLRYSAAAKGPHNAR